MSITAPVLIDDVLLKVLCFCDIHRVLFMSQASRRFYNLAFSKQVWLTLVSNLHSRLFLDLHERRLDNFSTEELVNLAKRAVKGPESWSTLYPCKPTIARQIILEPFIQAGPGFLFWENEVELLPGGKYVLFQNNRDLECWSLVRKELVWKYQGNWNSCWVVGFTAEMIDEGRVVIILVGVRTLEEERQNFIEILRLNLSTGDFRRVLTRRAPETTYDNAFSYCKICGDFAIVGLNTTASLMLLQLSTASCIILDLPTLEYAMDLIPDHIVVIRGEKISNSITIGVWSLQALIDSGEAGVPTELCRMPPIVTVTLNHNAPRLFNVYLSCCQSPLHEDSSIAWAVITTSTRGREYAVHKYRVFHPKSKPLSVDSIGSWALMYDNYRHPHHSAFISYAGFMRVYYHGDYRVVSLAAGNAGDKAVDLPQSGDYIHISTYSGALAYSTHENIVVNYYE